jgi:demethylmenaquinone methyltransferase/2-methoxy-6-polyprenyl-1,4-benzoquinol methylase
VRAAIRSMGRLGDVLELAAGTGLWTVQLLGAAASVHCVDAAPEALDINRWRCAADARVSYEVADLFDWRPPATYDTVFFGFWLSHVPENRFDAFWATAMAALRPGGRACFVDSLPDPTSTAQDHRLEAGGEVTRRLNDGREFRIVKVFRDRDQLASRLRQFGSAAIHATRSYFVFGTVRGTSA